MWSKQVAYMRYVVPNWVIPPNHAYRFEKFDTIFISQCLAPRCWDSLQEKVYYARKKILPKYVSRQIFIHYPFALIHVSFVTDQYFVHIVRSMLLNVPDPVPDVYANIRSGDHTHVKLQFCFFIFIFLNVNPAH